MIIPFWLKIVGPVVLFALVIGGVMAWGSSKYRSGKADGIGQTDAKWQAASDKLKADAAKSATRADDAAAIRHTEHLADARADQERIDEANRNGTSPLDALFN